MDFPGGSDWRICLKCSRPGFDLWVGKIPWRREWLPTPVFLPREFHGQRSLVGTVHRVTKSWTGLSNYHFQFFFKIFGNNGYPIEICFFLIGTSQCNLDKLQRKKSVLLSSGKSKYLTFKTDDQDLGNFISVFNSSADNKNSFIPPMLWPYHPKVTVRNSDSLWK